MIEHSKLEILSFIFFEKN